MLRAMKSSLVKSLLMLCLLGCLPMIGSRMALAQTPATTLDTTSGDQVFGVNGSPVGDWSPTGLKVYGNLTVGNLLILGQTNQACTPAIQGALRYYIPGGSTVGHVQYCNSVTWMGFSSQTFPNPTCGSNACLYGYDGSVNPAGQATLTQFCVQQGFSGYQFAQGSASGCNSCHYGVSNGAGGWETMSSGCNSCNGTASVTCQ